MVRDNNYGRMGGGCIDTASGDDSALPLSRHAGGLPRRRPVRSSLPTPRRQVVSPPNPDLLRAILAGLERLDLGAAR